MGRPSVTLPLHEDDEFILYRGRAEKGRDLDPAWGARPVGVLRYPRAVTDLSTVEHETILRVLNELRWNKAKAARRLGLSRTTLYYRIRKYGLE